MSLFQASQQWVDDVVEGFEDSVREPVVAHELPDVFLRVQLRAFCRQWDERAVGRNDQAAGEMPAGLIDEQRGVRARCDLGGDFGQVQVHGFGVTPRQDERRALAVLGADCAEYISGGGSLIYGSARTRSALGPTAGTPRRRSDEGSKRDSLDLT
jgi:hypothetical protein